jgi:hypothetical protein
VKPARIEKATSNGGFFNFGYFGDFKNSLLAGEIIHPVIKRDHF